MKRFLSLLILTPLLLSACAKRGRVQREIILGTEAYNVMMPTDKNVQHPEHGKEVWFGMGAMKGENGKKANGVAQAHVFEDGTTLATVNLNIEVAPKGSAYVAWLQKPGTAERIRIEELLNPLNDVRYLITADVAQDLRDWTEVVVTLQGPGGPSADDPVVASGILKQRTR